MSQAELIHYTQQAILLVLVLSLPVVITATTVGLLVGLFQALTQIQEQALPFGVKLVSVILVMMYIGGWIGNELLKYAEMILKAVPTVTS